MKLALVFGRCGLDALAPAIFFESLPVPVPLPLSVCPLPVPVPALPPSYPLQMDKWI
jgi:hypothetical protein